LPMPMPMPMLLPLPNASSRAVERSVIELVAFPASHTVSMAKTKCLKEFTGPEQSFYALSERGRGGFGLSDFESRRVLTDGAERRATPAPRSSRTWTTAWSGFEPSTRLYANSGDAIRREPEPTRPHRFLVARKNAKDFEPDEVFTTRECRDRQLRKIYRVPYPVRIVAR